MASTNESEGLRGILQESGSQFACLCYFVPRWLAYFFYTFARKVLVVLGLYGGLALALHHFRNSLFCENELSILSFLVLISILVVFLYYKWDDFSSSFLLRNYLFCAAVLALLDYLNQNIFTCSVCGYLPLPTALGITLVLQAVAYFLKEQKQYVGVEQSNFFYLPSDFLFRNWESAENILDWAKDDKPPKKDYFDFTQKARMIAERLIKSIDAKKNATIGLRGHYGSGKSTITELVESIVLFKNNRKDIIFVRANCWGFESTQSVQEYIIKKIIAGMSEARLDIDHLVGIPKRYVQVLSEQHAFLDVITTLYEEGTPEQVLKKIDKTLCYERKKLVLVLDDLDRNESNDFQLDKVEATLRRLRETKHISFIITGFYRRNKKGDNKIDFAKICDYIDETPILSNKNKVDCLMEIVGHHNKNVIRPQQDNWTFIDQSEPHQKALLDLIDTPRKLKIVIRDTDAAWSKDRLRGECDYVELFVFTCYTI